MCFFSGRRRTFGTRTFITRTAHTRSFPQSCHLSFCSQLCLMICAEIVCVQCTKLTFLAQWAKRVRKELVAKVMKPISRAPEDHGNFLTTLAAESPRNFEAVYAEGHFPHTKSRLTYTDQGLVATDYDTALAQFKTYGRRWGSFTGCQRRKIGFSTTSAIHPSVLTSRSMHCMCCPSLCLPPFQSPLVPLPVNPCPCHLPAFVLTTLSC